MPSLGNIIRKLAPWLIPFAIAVFATMGIRRLVTGQLRTIVTWVGTIGSVIILAILCGKAGAEMPQVASDSAHARGVDILKGVLALTAMACVFYEIRRIGERRPIAERWKKFVGVTLGVAGILFYFNTLKFGYPHYYHRWDQYHYYMGAKYFPEIGYDGLYKCSAIAQDDIGRTQVDVEGNGKKQWFDLRQEVRKSDKKIRNLGGDNLLIKVDQLLAHPNQCKPCSDDQKAADQARKECSAEEREADNLRTTEDKALAPECKQCTSKFTQDRWEQYKHDVTFFSTQCYLDSYWTQMQQDHGYNPPPVWTVAGYYLGNLHDADRRYMQELAVIDVLYLLGSFVAIYWAFGWRIFAVAAILFGSQSSAPFYWTGGALLRQDWLFFFVLSACLIRKKYFAWGAAAMVYAGLLRVFPGLVVLGWLTVVGWQLFRHRKLKPEHLRMLGGGTAAAVLLIGLSLAVVGKTSYQQFFKHTIEVHDQTPLTNHMGLRVLIGHDVGFDKSSGRMRYTKDGTKTDPFQTWKDMRLQRYIDYKPVAYSLLATTMFAFVLVLRRLKNMWVAQALGGVWIILLSQLTCYYYSYMLITGALTRLRRDLEVYLFAFGAITQLGWRTIGFNDDRYDYLTLISLIVSYLLLLSFAPKELTYEQRAKSKKPWYELLSGWTLGAIIAIVPGVVMIIQALIRRKVVGDDTALQKIGIMEWAPDWSSVLLGGISVAGGIGMYVAARRLRAGRAAWWGAKATEVKLLGG